MTPCQRLLSWGESETKVRVLTPSEGGTGHPLSAPCPRGKQPWDLLYTCKDAVRSQVRISPHEVSTRGRPLSFIM